MVMIIFKQTDDESMILGTNGEDAIKKGLRLLALVGNEQERTQANILLEELGEPIQQRPGSSD